MKNAPIPIPYASGDERIHELDERGNLVRWCQDWTCPCTARLIAQALNEVMAIEIDRGLDSRLPTNPDLPAQ